eukprot:scaffold1094_cov322-Prasinococcus_capsulatus_cf.AAC.2
MSGTAGAVGPIAEAVPWAAKGRSPSLARRPGELGGVGGCGARAAALGALRAALVLSPKAAAGPRARDVRSATRCHPGPARCGCVGGSARAHARERCLDAGACARRLGRVPWRAVGRREAGRGKKCRACRCPSPRGREQRSAALVGVAAAAVSHAVVSLLRRLSSDAVVLDRAAQGEAWLPCLLRPPAIRPREAASKLAPNQRRTTRRTMSQASASQLLRKAQPCCRLSEQTARPLRAPLLRRQHSRKLRAATQQVPTSVVRPSGSFSFLRRAPGNGANRPPPKAGAAATC